MKRNPLFATLPLLFAVTANAGEPVSTSYDPQLHNKGLVVAVTESGPVAADTAWLLSNQVTDGHDTPILLVLNPESRTKTLNGLQLEAENLPALIFLNSNGNEVSRVVGAAPASKVFEKGSPKTISMN